MIADADGAAVPAMPRAAVQPAATPAADRVPMAQKVGWGLGSFHDMWGHWLYQSMVFHVFNVFLGVAPGLISTALGLKIFVDAVADAMFGWLSDNTRTRWGRRRPYILVGGVLSGIGLLCCTWRSAWPAGLLAAARDFEADLLCMGAYSHSRLRQLILGGVTRHVLENADIPVLMRR